MVSEHQMYKFIEINTHLSINSIKYIADGCNMHEPMINTEMSICSHHTNASFKVVTVIENKRMNGAFEFVGFVI